MMKITLLKEIVYDSTVFPAGAVIEDCDDTFAFQLMKNGHATVYVEPKPVVEPKPAPVVEAKVEVKPEQKPEVVAQAVKPKKVKGE